MKNKLLLFALLMSGFCFAQNINDYKYIIVPREFDFLKEPNQFEMNNITKMMFEKYGFTVFFPDEKFPQDLALNRCKALYANVVKKTGFLSTNLSIELKDCQNQLIYESETGKSKKKDFKQAYYEALREASQSVGRLNYAYSENENATDIVQQAEIASKTQESAAPVALVNENTLFAQPIANGYQLIDSSPKIVLKIFRTSQPDSFTAVSETKNGVVFKKGNEWFFEYYKDDELISEKLDIKF